MKKGVNYRFFFLLSILLIVVFFAMVAVDYYKYDSLVTSAPFYLNILIRSFEFIIPSLVLFIIGVFIKKKNK